MKGTIVTNHEDLCHVEYKSGKSANLYLTSEERTILILSSKKDPITVCVPVKSTIKRYKGMHCTLINSRKKVYA